MQILSRRTDKAIVQLIREKIEKSKTTKELLKDDREAREAGKRNFETAAESLTREEIEIGQTVLTAMNEMDKFDEDDDF